jgi:hypothetical protein
MLGSWYDLDPDFDLFLSIGQVNRQPQRIKVIIGLAINFYIGNFDS